MFYIGRKQKPIFIIFFQNEISQAFIDSSGAEVNKPRSDIIGNDVKSDNKIDNELEPFLVQIDASIKADLSEILARYNENYNDTDVFNKTITVYDDWDNVDSSDGVNNKFCDSNSLESLANSVRYIYERAVESGFENTIFDRLIFAIFNAISISLFLINSNVQFLY